MREIKFRAWDEERKTMHEWKDTFFYDTSPVTNWSGNFSYIEMPIMQYTGLKDKNGVEIYEGDILQLGNTLSVVEYRISQFVLKEIAEDHHPNVLEFEVYKQSISSEVVGNIYENPELLEESK